VRTTVTPLEALLLRIETDALDRLLNRKTGELRFSVTFGVKAKRM